MTARVTLVNPLGAMLSHYGRESEWVLNRMGAHVSTVTTLEPSASEHGRLHWIVGTYARLALLALRSRRDHVILVWPLLGHVDIIVMNILFGRRGTAIVHDPLPLVRSVGHGRITTALARRCSRVNVVVHSQQAQAALEGQGFADVRVIPHPILDSAPDLPGHVESSSFAVVGQYKKDRDLDLLAGIARVAAGRVELRVHGRGWPPVPGWIVDDRFLSEAELDDVMTSSQAVLIPYKRFYQSGVAVRALELGTPVVGPADSSLSDMFHTCATNLPRTSSAEEWWSCMERAAGTRAEDLRHDHDRYGATVSGGWATLLGETS